MKTNDLPQIAPVAPLSVTAPTVATQQPQQPTTSFGQRWLEKQDRQFLASMRQAVQSDPDTYAESQKLSKQLGIPQETAERDDGYLRKLGRAIQVRNYNLGVTSPTLFRALQDPDFATKAQDDIEQLSLAESVAKAWKIGQMTSDRGTGALLEAHGQLAPEESMWLRGVEQYLRDNKEPAGFIPGLAGIMGQMSRTLPNAIEKGLGAAIGTAAVGAAIPLLEEVITVPTAFSAGFVTGMAQSSYQVEAGNLWRDMIDAGYDPERAATAATVVGAFNAALELTGAKIFTAPIRSAIKKQFFSEIRQRVSDRVAGNALWSFAKTYGKAEGGEIFTETGQEFGNILGELYAAEGKGDIGPIASRLADIAFQTFEGTALLGLPGAGAAARQTRQRAAIAKAKEFEAQVRAQLQAAADAKLAQRDPESLAQFIRDGGNDGEPMVAYVDAATLRDVLRQKDAEATDNGGGLTKSLESRLNEVSPGLSERITEAAASGGSVELDVAELAAKLGKDADVLTPHLRREPNSPSAAEADAAEQEAKKSGDADTGTDADKARAEALAKVRTEIEASLSETVQKAGAAVTSKEVRDAAKATAAMVETFAERDNTTPDKWWAANKPAFAVATDTEQSADVLSQPDQFREGVRKTDTPEFKAWFGESKVVNADGSPRVVYHGTGDNFTAFNSDKSPLMFFSESQGTALGYAYNRSQGRGGRVVEAYVAASNPATASDIEKVDISREIEALPEINPGNAEYLAKRAKFIQTRIAEEHGWMFTMKADAGVWRDVLVPALKRAGFDSIRIEDAGDTGTSLAVFDPTQIKSVNNRGTFDPNDPNILRQPDQFREGVRKTDTPEFKAWFGDSKVVDEAGKPLVVYHGSNADFDEFRIDGFPGASFFASNYGDALSYTRGRGLKGVRQFYLSMQNPLVWDAKGVAYGNIALTDELANLVRFPAAELERLRSIGISPSTSTDLIVSLAKSAGFDGVIIQNVNDSIEAFGDSGNGKNIYAVFDPTQIKSVNNRGTFDPNDPNILRQPARGFFDPKSLTVLLTSKSDATTVFHELNHWAVETMIRIAAQPNGSPSIKADVDVLFARWGVAGIQEWYALPAKERAAHLEDIAYNFEDWLATGKAPSKELLGVFERIKAVLVRVYKFVRETLNKNYRAEFGRDLPALTPELRGVFDRMLASQAAIEQAIAEREGAALFDVQKDGKALGITEDEARLLRVLDEERRAEATARVQAEAMRGTRYFESQRRSEESKLRKQAREKRAEVREQVSREVAAMPVYRAMAWINAGEVDNNGTMESAKLDANAVKSILGPDAGLIPKSLTKANGQSPDITAQQFGFRTGHDLLRAIIGALPMEQAVEARTDERMDAEFGSLSDPKKMQQAVEEALHTKAATRYAATILRALLKTTQPTAVLEAAAMSAARSILRGTPISQISPKLYAAAESRAVKAMRKALASGDVKEAIDATRKWLLQHSLTRLSLDVQKEVDKFVDGTVEKVLQPDQKIIDGKRNLDVVMAARAVLGERDLAPGRRFERALNYLESLRELNVAEFDSLSASVSALDQFGRKGYRELTLDEFRVLTSTVEALWERAKRVEQYASWDGEMLLRADVRERLIQAATEGGLGKPGTPDFAAEERTWTWDNFLSNLRRIESWTISVDGKEGGYWHRYVYRKLAKAYNDYQEISLDGQRWWRDLVKGVDNLNGQQIDAQAWLGTGVVFRNREHLLGALIHHGNSSNRTAMLEGEGWSEAGWFAFLDAMQENGTLTKADFDAVQAVWNRNDKVYRPLMQGVNRKVYGTYFEEVKAEPFQTRFGTYPGGYAPAKVDPARNADISTRGGFQAIADGEQQFKQSFANAPRGSTIKRTGVRRPRLLSFEAQGQHIDEVARFLAMSEALRDVAGLFTGGPLVDYLNNVAPAAIKSIIAPAVERMARNQIVAPMNGSGGAKIVGNVATWLRRSTSMSALGFNIRNALQQYTGAANAIQYTGAGRFWSSFWSYVTNGTDMSNEAMAESKMMRNRLSQEAAKLAEDLALMFDPSLLGRVSRWANHYGYWLQRKTQMQVDVVTWHAARQKAYDELLPTMGPEKARVEAIERADSVVRRAQGARTPLDIASFSGGNAVMQLFTQFSDYPNLVLNQILEQRGLARQAGAVVMVLLLPSLASGAIALSMAGFRAPGSKSGDGDDDKDGRYDDDIAAYLFGQTLRGVGSLLPVAGPAMADAVFAGEQAVDRAQPFAAWSVAQSMLRLIAGGRSAALAWSEGQPTEFGAQDARDVATVLGTLGLPMSGPLGRAWSYVEQVDAGRVEPSGPLDFLRGIVNGR